MIRFLVAIAALSALLLFIARTWFPTAPTWDIAITSFLAITTFLVVYLLQPIKAGNPEKFTRVYLMSITIKILVACIFVISFVLVDRPGADFNALLFLIGYVMFTAAEVISLLVANDSKKASK